MVNQKPIPVAQDFTLSTTEQSGFRRDLLCAPFVTWQSLPALLQSGL